MKSIIIAVSFLLAAVSATPTGLKNGRNVGILGVVDTTRCGGVGTQRQLRISGCEGRCSLTPGRVYECENDFMPSSAAPSLNLRVEVCTTTGFCMIIIDTELQGSSVQPGYLYTAKYTMVPNDILAGQTVEFRGYITHTDNQLLEICVSAFIDIVGIGPTTPTPSPTTQGTTTQGTTTQGTTTQGTTTQGTTTQGTTTQGTTIGTTQGTTTQGTTQGTTTQGLKAR